MTFFKHISHKQTFYGSVCVCLGSSGHWAVTDVVCKDFLRAVCRINRSVRAAVMIIRKHTDYTQAQTLEEYLWKRTRRRYNLLTCYLRLVHTVFKLPLI